MRALGRKTVSAPASPELASALAEQSASPGRHLLNLLSADGVFNPAALLFAMLAASAGVLFEAVLFQSLLRGALAIWPVAAFSAILLLLEWPLMAELLRDVKSIVFYSRSAGDIACRA